jgi:AcrR family transcriptional regulator
MPTMTDTLRDRQKQVARELILQAAADEIVEGGLEQLSLQAVAERAGVSKRTLYNYFDSRETLLAAIGEWSDELTLEMGGYLVPTGLDELPMMVRAVWRTWSAQGAIYEAMLVIEAAANATGISEGRRARRAALAAAVGTIRPDLSAAACSDVAAVLHAVTSAPVYRRLTTEDGIDIDTATSVIAWALTALRDSLLRGDDPFPKEDTT